MTYPKPQQLPRGAAQAALNFLTRATWIEQRGGYHPLGTEAAGSGKVLGMVTAHKWDGTEVSFRATKDGKLAYWDGTNWTEVGSNLLSGAAASGETIYFSEYTSPAGSQLWLSSPSTDLIKIMVANPGSYVSQYNSAKNFKGNLKIIGASMYMWNYATGLATKAKAVLQRSYIDAQNYVTTTAEVLGSGDGATKTFAGTLAQVSGKKTCFAVSITAPTAAGTETFVDDYLGGLSSNAGGTGTINYATGAYSVTFNAAPSTGSNNVTATYQTEDSTNGGIADFTKSAPRQAAQGVAWIQTSGGDILGVEPYNGSIYVLHQRNAWVVTPSADDTTATNVIYRSNMALASERGSIATADGIYYVDVSNASRPYIAILTYNPIASQVLPIDLSSDLLDLSGFVFDKSFAIQALDFILFFCRTSDSTQNNRVLLYNFKLSSSKRRIFDLLDYFGSCASVLAGQVIAGDSVTNNVFKLFDGFDDDNGTINSYWIGNADDHGYTGLKKTKRLWLEGFIATNQSVDIYVQLDAGGFVKIGTIKGTGKYVDTGIIVTIGSLQVGVYPIGGPSSAPAGYHYLIEIKLNSALYKDFTIKLAPTAVGYFSCQMYANYDIRTHVEKLPTKYRA
ncbi:MAG: hypothetical protein KGI03_00975 [Patescibacteria group bacterium]|nr:hypothetical protein [Patescibacteria group bacterium]